MASIGAGLLPIAFLLATAATVDRVLDGKSRGDLSPVVRMLALATGLYIAEQGAVQLRGAVGVALRGRLDGDVRATVVDLSLSNVELGFVEDPNVATSLSAVRSVTAGGFTPGAAAEALGDRITRTVTGVCATAVLAWHLWWAALLLATACTVLGAFGRHQVVRSLELLAGRATLLRRTDYLREFALSSAAWRETRLFGLDQLIRHRHRESWLQAMRDVWAERSRGGLGTAGLLLAVAAAFAVTFGALASRLVSGAMSPAAFVAAATGALQVTMLAALSEKDQQLEYGIVPLRALADLVAHASTPPASTAPAVARRRAEAGTETETETETGTWTGVEFEFEDVTFAYPGAAAPVLEGVSVAIPALASVALVGPNGAGKTTFVKLLCGLYRPTSGRILVNGVDLATIDRETWHARVAVVFQDFLRWELTLSDNVFVGANRTGLDASRVDEVLAAAGLDDVVRNLPNGVDTILSRHYDTGTDLSGGQWQRVGLARCIAAIRNGAQVAVFDEPTAHLDLRSEAMFVEQFLALTRSVTAVVVSHRFATVRLAGHVCVFEAGRIAEQGSHDELIARQGRYAEMFDSQMRWMTAADAS